MENSGVEPSRRRLLGFVLGGSLAGLAGCLGDDDSDDDNDAETPENGGDGADVPEDGSDDPDETSELQDQFELAGDGADQFANWLSLETPHPEENGVQTLFAYQNFEEAVEQGWDSLGEHRQLESQTFGTEPESMEGELLIDHPDESIPFSNIHLGEFDTESIVSHLTAEGGSVTDEYGEYTIIEGNIAVGSDALIVTPEYEQFIDTRHDDGAHLKEEYDGLDQLLELQPTGVQISATTRSELDDLSVSASSFMSVNDDGNPERIVRTFVFESAADASVERAEEIAADGSYKQTLTGESHDRVVMLEYET